MRGNKGAVACRLKMSSVPNRDGIAGGCNSKGNTAWRIRLGILSKHVQTLPLNPPKGPAAVCSGRWAWA